jgi:hypothetical protein
MWSDHEEERFQLRNRRVRILRALFCGFVLLAAGALILRDAASVALFIAALVALGATALLGRPAAGKRREAVERLIAPSGSQRRPRATSLKNE